MCSNRKLGCVHEDRAGPSFEIGECYPLHGRTARQVAHITAKRGRSAFPRPAADGPSLYLRPLSRTALRLGRVPYR
jgi:hypothetical protein